MTPVRVLEWAGTILVIALAAIILVALCISVHKAYFGTRDASEDNESGR